MYLHSIGHFQNTCTCIYHITHYVHTVLHTISMENYAGHLLPGLLTLNLFLFYIQFLQNGDQVCSSFTSSILSPGQYVPSGKCYRDALLLNWRWHFISLLKNTHQELSFQTIVFKLISLPLSNILKKGRLRMKF